jgi:hypothetical protein
MKTTSKLMATVVLASTLIASSALAGNEAGRQRMGERNAEYFQQNGSKMASASSASTTVYDTDVSPKHRMGQRNAEYFSSKAADMDSQPARAKSVTHPTKH